MPLDDVPDGADASKNVEHHQSGKKREYAFKPKQHFELGEALGMMDFELAAKLSGARFVVLQKGLARLERALGQFMLDLHTGEAWLHRSQSAADGARRGDVRHGAVAKVCDDQFSQPNNHEKCLLHVATWMQKFESDDSQARHR